MNTNKITKFSVYVTANELRELAGIIDNNNAEDYYKIKSFYNKDSTAQVDLIHKAE